MQPTSIKKTKKPKKRYSGLVRAGVIVSLVIALVTSCYVYLVAIGGWDLLLRKQIDLSLKTGANEREIRNLRNQIESHFGEIHYASLEEMREEALKIAEEIISSNGDYTEKEKETLRKKMKGEARAQVSFWVSRFNAASVRDQCSKHSIVEKAEIWVPTRGISELRIIAPMIAFLTFWIAFGLGLLVTLALRMLLSIRDLEPIDLQD